MTHGWRAPASRSSLNTGLVSLAQHSAKDQTAIGVTTVATANMQCEG
jgi:hypothetical protein